MTEEMLVPAIEKAMRIIELLANSSSYLGVSKIASELNLNKGTVFSILKTLVHYHLVEKNLVSGKYMLGGGFTHYAEKYQHNLEDTSDFIAVASILKQSCSENINFSVLKGAYNCVIASIPSEDHSLRVDMPIGTMIPVIASSAGKMLVSQMDVKTLEEIYDNQYSRYTSRTIANKPAFLEEVRLARQQGYAINNAEYEPGICSIGAPVFNSKGVVVAAINIVIPEIRFTPETKAKILALVTNSAKELSVRRGFKQK